MHSVIPELKLRKSKSIDRNPRKQLEMLEHFQERRRHEEPAPSHKYTPSASQPQNEEKGKTDSSRQVM